MDSLFSYYNFEFLGLVLYIFFVFPHTIQLYFLLIELFIMSIRFIFELADKLSHITLQLLYLEDWLIKHLLILIPLLLHLSQQNLAMIIIEWKLWVVEICHLEVGWAHAIVF